MIEGGTIRELRRLANRRAEAQAPRPATVPEERCDMCSITIPADHRHLLHLEDRLIVCTCETCRALFAGEGAYIPTGSRTVWLPDLD
ncbi:MAG: DUF5947 family protein, partial [Gaiellales bacterium]